MRDKNRRQVLKSIGLGGFALTLVSSVNGATPMRSPPGGEGSQRRYEIDKMHPHHGHPNRPDISIINNTKEKKEFQLKISAPNNKSILNTNKGLGSSQTNRGTLPVKTTVNIPNIYAQKVDIEVKVNKESKIHRTVPLGQNGMSKFKTLSLDVRENKEKVGISVV